MNTKTVVATTTLTVGKEGGPIKASAKLEAVPTGKPWKVGVHNSGTPCTPLQPSAPQRSTGMQN